MPSNFFVSANTTLSMGRLMPCPMTSVVTMIWYSPRSYLAICSLLTSSGRAPYRTPTLFPLFWATSEAIE